MQGGEDGETVEAERLVDLGQVVGLEGSQVDSSITAETASDALNAIEGDCAGGLRGNDNVALVDGAGADGKSITAVLDGGSAFARSLCYLIQRWLAKGSVSERIPTNGRGEEMDGQD